MYVWFNVVMHILKKMFDMISQLMRFIKRESNGKLSADYATYELYCHQQKTYFKKLSKVKKRTVEDSLPPGKKKL